MRFKSIVFVLLTLTSLPAFSQSSTVVERTFACSLINGFTINDAVSVMRAFEWDEDFAPGGVMVREAVYGSDSFLEDWDFVVNLYYPSMEDLIEKRLAFRSRTGGSEGYDLRDVARCSNGVRLNSVDFVPGQGSGGDISDFTSSLSINCERNGAPLSGMRTAAENIANLMGPGLRTVQIIDRQFGGPSQPIASRIAYRLIFNSAEDFATTFDSLRSNAPEQTPNCNTPSGWGTYPIYVSNN